MQIVDRVQWDRALPVRYLLVHWDEDGVEELVGRCAGVEGLFVTPAPLPREVLTLRGCSPDGPLSDVVSGPDAWPRSLGDVRVEVWDDEHQCPMQWWTLVDAAVVFHQPHPDDPARYDIVLGAGVRHDESFSKLPARPRFELFAGTTATAPSAGRCSAVEGLFEQRADPVPIPMELIGCEPAEPLLAALRRPQWWKKAWAEWITLTTRGWRERTSPPDRSGGDHHLDGRFVTDVPGLHCAMAEALLGPGQYFGHGWDAFKDCLCGGFGVVPPFTLTWHDSDVARRALAEDVDLESGLSYFEEIVQLLRQRGATVVLR